MRCKRPLTEKQISKLPTATGKQVIHWDGGEGALEGFGVLCSGKTNAKTYVAQRRMKGRGTRRITIGPTSEISLAEAKGQALEIFAAMRAGKDPRQKRGITLGATLQAYLKAKDIRPSTAELYTSHVKQHLNAWLDRPLATISPDEVAAMLEAIQRKVAERSEGKHLGNTIANEVIKTFNRLYSWRARKDDDLPRSPVRLDADEWHEETPEKNRRAIADEDMPKWYQAVRSLSSDMAQDFLLLLLFTGMRLQEVAALRWTEVDLERKTFHLPASRTKQKKPLNIPMSSHVYRLLAKRRKQGDATFVFWSFGRTGHIRKGNDWIRKVKEGSGIEFSAHDLRRTFITTAARLGVNESASKSLVGHSLGKDVHAIYIKPMEPEELREPAEVIANRLMQLCRIPPTTAISADTTSAELIAQTAPAMDKLPSNKIPVL
jgi:integrase